MQAIKLASRCNGPASQNIYYSLHCERAISENCDQMKLLSAPRQPFVGLALMAATGIAAAEIVPLRSTELMLATILLATCIVVALCWSRLATTYLIVSAGFFLLHKFAIMNTAGQQLADKLGERPRVVTVVGCVISEPKIAPRGFATFRRPIVKMPF